MPLDADTLATYIRDRGPFLYHVTSREHVDSILREGLRAGSEIGRVSRDDFFETRPGRVYFADVASAPLVPAEDWAIVRVDLTQLEPGLFDTDEDLAQGAGLHGEHWVERPPPTRRVAADGQEEAGQAGLLRRWAETTPGFDSPEVVAKSLADGRVAYRGPVPPDALAAADVASEGAERFRARAAEALGGSTDLPAAARIAYHEVESERAFRLVETVVAGALELANHPGCAVRVRDPHAALRLGEKLSRDALEITRAFEFPRDEVVRKAGELAERAADLREIGWPNDRRAFLSIADAGGELVAATAAWSGERPAGRLAAAGLEAMDAAF